MKTEKLIIIPPGRPLSGRVSPPGSKSITNRALLLAGLAKGTSRLTGALKSDDTRYMADALRAIPSDEVTMELTNGLSPLVLTPVDDKNDFAYMILPVRIKN